MIGRVVVLYDFPRTCSSGFEPSGIASVGGRVVSLSTDCGTGLGNGAQPRNHWSAAVPYPWYTLRHASDAYDAKGCFCMRSGTISVVFIETKALYQKNKCEVPEETI